MNFTRRGVTGDRISTNLQRLWAVTSLLRVEIGSTSNASSLSRRLTSVRAYVIGLIT